MRISPPLSIRLKTEIRPLKFYELRSFAQVLRCVALSVMPFGVPDEASNTIWTGQRGIRGYTRENIRCNQSPLRWGEGRRGRHLSFIDRTSRTFWSTMADLSTTRNSHVAKKMSFLRAIINMHSVALTARRWHGGENGTRMRHLKSMKNGEIDPNWRPSASKDGVTYLSSYHPFEP